MARRGLKSESCFDASSASSSARCTAASTLRKMGRSTSTGNSSTTGASISSIKGQEASQVPTEGLSEKAFSTIGTANSFIGRLGKCSSAETADANASCTQVSRVAGRVSSGVQRRVSKPSLRLTWPLTTELSSSSALAIVKSNSPGCSSASSHSRAERLPLMTSSSLSSALSRERTLSISEAARWSANDFKPKEKSGTKSRGTAKEPISLTAEAESSWLAST
mmetsp:Transcript_89668/g.192162  ORF Transcript_89668/g.192162 Transcript_89668/m.192162 type:complete len:222 (+) Transcript_89668:3034-3699(+)